MRETLTTLFQYYIPQHTLSRVVGWLANCKQTHIKNAFIKWFVDRYQVDMSSACEPDPLKFADFNSFFTRQLRVDARPLVSEPKALACPVDGSVSQAGPILDGRIFQAKGFDFSLEELLGGVAERAQPFVRGLFATLYLAPKDYHRIHMPIDGTLREMVHVPGRLFSVNPKTTRNVPGLFARNERVVAIFDTEIGPMALVLVGAMIVASINTVWHGEVTPPHTGTLQTWRYPERSQPGAIHLARGAEMGSFKLGSTVLVLFGEGVANWVETLQAERVVRMGEHMGDML